MAEYYDELLELCGFDTDEINRERPRIGKVFQRLELGPQDMKPAIEWVRQNHDIELAGVRKILAIWLREQMPDIDKRDALILATDISKRMLEKAHLAIYPVEILKSLPSPHFKKYFNKINGQHSGSCRIADEVRQMVRLAWLNLLESWPMKGPFNVIFCRNVMIYFDRPTQQRLINRFWELLEPGGFLFVGHSEGLSAINHKFRYMRPATYRK